MSQAATTPSRQQLRLRSIAWALGAGVATLLLGLPLGLESALVGAVCGLHSLGLQALAHWPEQSPLPTALVAVAPTVMMELIRTWLPLVGAALVLHGIRLVAQRVLPSRTVGPAAGAQASTHRP